MSDISVPSEYDCNYFKAQNPKNSFQMNSYRLQLEKSRSEDLQCVMKSVNEVRSDFESLKSEVRNLTNDPDCLKKKLCNIEGKISQLKEAIREELLSLLQEEVNLSRDIHFVDKKLEEWGKPVDFQTFKTVKKSNYSVRDINSDNPTVEFQKFLSSSGGHYGGWEEQDHLLFIRERNKHKKKEKFFSVIHSLLPDLTYEDIEDHEKWYQKYESLKNNQKEAIQKWRSEKENNQKKNKENEGDGGDGGKKKTNKTIRNQIDIAERIKEWKNQQLLKKLEEEERQKKEKEKLKEEEKRKKDIQEMKKRAVAQYKSEKLNKLQERVLKEDNTIQTEEAKAKNKVLLKAFRLQDLKYIQKKKILKLQIESKSNEKIERLRLAKPALELILQRNPQRIFQPTLIWNQHCLENQKKEKLDYVFDLNSIPRLAVPEWRRELK